MKKIAINGFGRIGRAAFKVALTKQDIEVVAINDLTDAFTLAHLLKYDSIYGTYGKEVGAAEDALIVDGKKYAVTAIKEPEKLPWKDKGVDVVIESTGRFTTQLDASKHLAAGAQHVIISAPVEDDEIPTCLIGVNAEDARGKAIISNASCTTNCIGPVAAIIDETLGIKKAMMTTVHAYTADQMLVDGPHKDLRRARAAQNNIIPTTTGAAIAVTQTLPKLKGLFDGLSLRVPVPIVSLSDFTILVGKPTSPKEINDIMTAASEDPRYKGIVAVTNEQLVSSDFIGNSASAIIDLNLTNVIDGDFIKIIAWYDNEWGYSNRLIELASQM